jgi:hypothetical protein
MKALLISQDLFEELPTNVIPNLNAQSLGRNFPSHAVATPALARAIAWFIAVNGECPTKFFPEFAQYRDMAYWTKVCHTIRLYNKVGCIVR